MRIVRLLCGVTGYGDDVWYLQACVSRVQVEVLPKQAAPASPAVRDGAVPPPQGPVARGMMSQAEVDAIHAFMTQRVRIASLRYEGT